MNDKTQLSPAGIAFPGMLGCLFIALKLCGVIGWPWWVVLLPILGPIAILFVSLLFFVTILSILK